MCANKKLKDGAVGEGEPKKTFSPPPEEHSYELKMEKRLRKLLGERKEKLSPEELRFYSRQIMLEDVGYSGQVKLSKSTVCIIGLGGLGSTIATQLATMGVGHLVLVDFDVVEESNLQRQHLYNFDVIGFPKVEACVERLQQLNPYIKLQPVPVAFAENNSEAILSGVDVVVDGLDNMQARYLINRACVRLGIPYIFGSAISTFGNVSTIIPQKTPCLECFYGNLDDENLPNCSTIGIHPSVLGIIASIEVAETIKVLLGNQPSLQNKLLYCDVSSMRFEEIMIARVRTCPICGGESDAKPMQLKRSWIQEGCGRNNRRVFTLIPKSNLDLNLHKLARLVEEDMAHIIVEAGLGVTFSIDKFIASILKSGVMIIEGANNKKEASDFYKEIVAEKLGVDWAQIE
jgi:adenylyltransferase/sulfurtransferase